VSTVCVLWNECLTADDTLWKLWKER
jgi:hypothetical protein